MGTIERRGRFAYRREYVPACDAWIWIAEDENGVFWFPVRASCRALCIDSPSQLTAIRGDSRLAPGLQTIPMPSDKGNGMQQSKCLRRPEYPQWLGLIDPQKCRPEARAKLSMRQDALRQLADSVMFRRDDELPTSAALARALAGALDPMSAPASLSFSGELHFNCEVCGAPHCIVIDASGVHVYVGDEAK